MDLEQGRGDLEHLSRDGRQLFQRGVVLGEEGSPLVIRHLGRDLFDGLASLVGVLGRASELLSGLVRLEARHVLPRPGKRLLPDLGLIDGGLIQRGLSLRLQRGLPALELLDQVLGFGSGWLTLGEVGGILHELVARHPTERQQAVIGGGLEPTDRHTRRLRHRRYRRRGNALCGLGWGVAGSAVIVQQLTHRCVPSHSLQPPDRLLRDCDRAPLLAACSCTGPAWFSLVFGWRFGICH